MSLALRSVLGKPLILAALLAWIGYVLLLVPWVMANPPFESPDERNHYVRALAVEDGQLIGAKVRVPLARTERPLDSNARARAEWFNVSARVFPLESRHVSPRLHCDWLGDGPFRCSRENLPGPRTLAKSYVGTYPPLPYLVPGFSAHFASNSIDGLRLGRAGSALVAALFLLVALLASADARATFAASAFAVTPMVVFTAASLNPSSTEIASGLCFAATGLRQIREPARGRWWIPMGLSGATLGLSRSTGFLWLALLAAMLLTVEPRLVRSPRPRRGLALALLGFSGGIAWSVTQEPHLPPTLTDFSEHLDAALRSLESLLKGAVGSFGYLNVQLPGVEVAAWLLGVTVLLSLAALAADRRGLVVLASAVAACIVVPVGFHTLVYSQTGFGPQARYFLPFWVALPPLAGHVLASAARRPRLRLLFAFSALAVPAVQFLAWYTNTRHWVVGSSGPRLFIQTGGWSPPLGVVPWLCLATAGSLTLALAQARAAAAKT